MKNSKFSILGLALLLFAVAFSPFLACKQQPEKATKNLETKGIVISTVTDKYLEAQLATVRHKTQTPKGALVFSAAKTLSPEMLNAIDDGFDRLAVVAAHYDYKNFVGRENYVVFVIEPDRVYREDDGAFAPAFKVELKSDNPYAGSEYDRGGWMYAAERVLDETIDTNVNKFIVLNVSDNYGYVSDTTLYGGEHCLEYHNNKDDYEQDKYHQRTGGHPIRPIRNFLQLK